MARLASVCPECRGVFHRDGGSSSAYCPECKPPSDSYVLRTKTKQQRGYDARWDRLSKRARALQPFCSDCGSPEDLTADHTVEAWRRYEAGKRIRLQDIDVVCRSCNSERGEARGENISERRLLVDQELKDRRANLLTDDDSDLFLSD